MADNTNKRGLANADKETRERVAREGGKASSGSSSKTSGTMSRSEVGSLGAQAQPLDAKIKGGRHSHDNR